MWCPSTSRSDALGFKTWVVNHQVFRRSRTYEESEVPNATRMLLARDPTLRQAHVTDTADGRV
jgi:hypothetical protein